MNLYNKYAHDFSETRQAPWQGWIKLLPHIKKLDRLRVLDLGCGNGRFLKFLVENNITIEKYTGVDSSNEMLTMADQFMDKVRLNAHISSFELKNIDLEKKNWDKEIDGEYNLVVGFGIMHHLSTFEARKRILQDSYKFLAPSGCLILTYWQFAKYERYKKLTVLPLELTKNYVLKENDFFLTFGPDKKAYRFCHYCDDREVLKLQEETKLKKVEDFYSDGKENDQNLYIIYQKEL